MEELGFFNEREAECFEREDTLSQTDLEKLNVDEDMPEMERTEYLLRTGLDKQKLSVLASLPKILASNNSKANLTTVLECLKGVWQKCEAEANGGLLPVEVLRALAALSCATVDGKVLRSPEIAFYDDYHRQLELCREERANAVFLLSDEQVAKQVVPFVLDLISEAHHKEIAEAASAALIASLPRLAGNIKKTQIIRVAMDKGDVSQPPGSRLICCLLLGAVTALELVTGPDIEGLYFQKMMALCQDTDAEVRKCMCIQLDALARAVGQEKAASELLPELLELLQDEEEQVKQSAFLALLSLVDFFPAPERIKRIIPEFQSFAESLPEYLVSSFTEHLGEMVIKLATLNHLGSDVAGPFLQSYSRLCTREDPELRQYCAYNFPAMVKAFGPSYVPMLMDDLLAKLANDAVERVRVHVASGLHEVALLLGPQRASRYLKPVVLSLLRDDAPSVHGTILSRVPALMSSTFAIVDDDHKATMVDAVLKSIVQYHSILPASRNRDQIAFVEILEHFPTWVSSEQMYEMVIPILFDLIEDGARPVQLLATQALVKCIRRNDNSSHRFSLLSKLRAEYGHARSYWRRLLYLEACVAALELNSRQYCRLNFLDIAIELLEDPVPNVRLKAYSLIPQWKVILTALSDDKMLERVNQFLDECTVDSDRDVAGAMFDVRQTVENNDLSQHQRRPQDEAEDKRRVAEEESLGLVSDHEDSSADSKWSSMLEYTLVVGKDGQVVRRARVKSLDLANKLSARTQGKDTSRTGNGGGVGLGSGSMASMSSLVLSKTDVGKSKISPKTPSKPLGGTLTTLPNCTPARPPNPSTVATKMPQAVKVLGSSGKLNTSGSKSATGSSRNAAAIAKDSNALTKIPIIRPSAPAAKRESSPSTGTKPSNMAVGPPTLLSSNVGSTTSSPNPAGSGMAAAAMKGKLGSIESSTTAAPSKPKAVAPGPSSSVMGKR